jgi:hypothetical protein
VHEVHGRDTALRPIKVQVGVEDCLVTMVVDTGAFMSLMPETTYRRLWPGRGLSATSVRPSIYSKEPLPVVESTQVHRNLDQLLKFTWLMRVKVHSFPLL